MVSSLNSLLTNEFKNATDALSQKRKPSKQNKQNYEYCKSNLNDNNSFIEYLRMNLFSKKRYRKPKNRFDENSHSALFANAYKKRIRNNNEKALTITISSDEDNISSSEEESDDEWVLPLQFISKNKTTVPKKQTTNTPMKETSTNKKIYKKRIHRELKQIYSRRYHESSEMFENNSDTIVTNKRNRRYKWIMELKSKENGDVHNNYQDNCLVILKNFDKNFYKLSLHELKYDINSLVTNGTRSIIYIIQRTNDMQLYCAQGLQKCPHFSLSSYQTKLLKEICKSNSINCKHYEIDREVRDITLSVMSFKYYHNTLKESIRTHIKSICNFYACFMFTR